uniref:Uncharacterized protein n=1 Tax=Moniliophthora roreri TaxID=221103 RepID=A0A0W0FXJ4_MONRR
MIATTLSSLRPPHFKLWDLAIGDGLEYGHWRAGNQPGCGKRFRMAMIRSMQVYSVALLKKRAGRFSSSFLLQNYLVFAELKATAHEIERNSAPFTLTLTKAVLVFPTTHSCLSPTTISLSAVMSFVNSSHTVITGENTLNHVQGNQVNGTINAGTVNFNTGRAVMKRTERDEFQYVRRGDMIKVKELGSVDLSEWDWEWQNGELVGRYKSSAQKRIYTVEIVDRQSKFTAMIYEGEDAQDLWEKDFRQFSPIRNYSAINQSAIPALIFHHELIPCAHFYTGSFWMNVYIQYLARNMDCGYSMLWMNTTSGMLFSGPDGPSTQFSSFYANELIVVPPTIGMLKDDTSFRFFSKFGPSVDDNVLVCAVYSYKDIFLADLFPRMAEDHRSKDADRYDWMHRCLRGLWFKRSMLIFELAIIEGKENFFIVEPPHLTLKSTQCPRTFPTLHNAEHPIEETMPTPIYLFVHSLPTTLSEIVSWLERPCYFWSFDKTGQSRLSEEECERWGLPVLVPDTGFLDRVVLCSWPTHIYTTLQDWQKATGFDPTTSDWARSRGYPEWEIVGTEDRFVLVEEALTEDLEWEFLDV